MTPSTSAVHILDFPTEVLSCIFGFVKLAEPFELDGLRYFENLTQNTTSIKSLRLVCTKFSTIATPLLLPIASCSVLDSKSLDRLDEISHHAIFSRLVKVVRVRLGFLDEVIAKDPVNLATYLSWTWRRHSKASDNAPSPLVDAVVDDWERLSMDPSSDVGAESLRILKSIHAEYKRRYLAQFEAHRSGASLRRLAQAMARMPAATRLVMDDEDHQYRNTSHLGALLIATVGAEVVDESSLAALAAPMSWYSCWHLKSTRAPDTALKLCHPPIDLIINLPVAVHQAGVALTGLRIINLQIPRYVPAWDSGAPYLRPLKLSARDELREACRTLQVLEVTPVIYVIGNHCTKDCKEAVDPVENFGWTYQPERRVQWTRFATIVKLMLSKSLRHLHLDSPSISFRLASWANAHNGDDFCEHMFGGYPLPNLEVLHLTNNSIGKGSELIQLIRNSEAIYQVRLIGISMRILADSGELIEEEGWSLVVDGLQEQTPRMRDNWLRLRGSVMNDEPVRITSASWGELNASPPELWDLGKDLFAKEIDGFSAVEDYIRGATDQNPLVEAQKLYPYEEWDHEGWR
ncbi:hypothetical protein MCOR08_009787 [Pyricularia oryzae]|nr:hypothetical protein MCOR09_009607 [Pyricularia oryzae]KAI6615259.1 hypothetical protein MCOR08_009787 [Pyricularia oryzae]